MGFGGSTGRGDLKAGPALIGEGVSSSSSSILSYYKSKVWGRAVTFSCGAFEAGEAGWLGAGEV